MPSRREFLHQGLGALAVGMLGPRALGVPGIGRRLYPGRDPAIDLTNPFLTLPGNMPSVMVDGMPFADWFTGDDFRNDAIPFHSFENLFPGGEPPAPTEHVNLVVVGGGLSGLCSAYLLRRHRPVVFDLRSRFGGNSQGEDWDGHRFSLGGAYCITPDDGSFLDHLYRDLGLRQAHRLDEGDNPTELNGQILSDYYSGSWIPADQRPAFDRYRQIVQYYANEAYPDIPYELGPENQWIRDLDRKTFRQDIEERLAPLTIPPLLHAGIQSYCYSSFGGGYEELSAAGGWNFLAAEEYGRWVFPGGNPFMAQSMWEPLADLDRCTRPGGRPEMLRAGCRVVDVRVRAGGSHRVQVTYKDTDGAWKSLLAKRVVMACSKHLCKYIIHDLANLDNAKYEAMQRVEPVAYCVANVLLSERLDRDFYDLFLLRDGAVPADGGGAELNSRVCDLINGRFARHSSSGRKTVLTLYWPLPWGNSRFTFFTDNAFEDYSARLVPQIDSILSLLGLTRSAVRQVRMTRWGHAFPLSRRGFIADGIPQQLLRPFEGLVYFVNQDNWALPAVENSLLDAQGVAEILNREL